MHVADDIDVIDIIVQDVVQLHLAQQIALQLVATVNVKMEILLRQNHQSQFNHHKNQTDQIGQIFQIGQVMLDVLKNRSKVQ